MGILLRTTIVVMFFISSSVGAGAHPAIETCLQQSLTAVLAGGDIERYLDTTAIVITVLGKQSENVRGNPQVIEDITRTILAVLAERVQGGGNQYHNATVKLVRSNQSSAIGFITTATGQKHAFRVLGNFNTGQCQIRQLMIEDIFRLTAWLGRQPAVEQKMSQYHLK